MMLMLRPLTITAVSILVLCAHRPLALAEEHQKLPVADRFTDKQNGAVVDKETGLASQKSASEDVMRYDQAVSYCRGLAVAGFKDWRLPTLFELNDLYHKLSWKGEDHREPDLQLGTIG